MRHKIIKYSFLLILFLPAIQSLTGIFPEPKMHENRATADWVSPADVSLNAFPPKFEAWFNDHLGLRNTMLSILGRVKAVWLCTSVNKDVLIGKDGWYFYTADRSLDDFFGAVPFNLAEIEKIQSNLLEKQTRLKKMNCLFAAVIVPNKQTVMPEMLPSWAESSGQSSRLKQLEIHFSNLNLPLFDLTQPLLEAKKRAPVFLHTDSHWSDFGAFTGAISLQNKLYESDPRAAIFETNQITIRSQTGGAICDLTWKLMAVPPSSIDETWVLVENFQKPAEPFGKLVIFHDSCWIAMEQYSEGAFEQVTAQHKNVKGFDWDLIEKTKPDYVIWQTVERDLPMLIKF